MSYEGDEELSVEQSSRVRQFEAYLRSMVFAYDVVMTKEQRAELHAWEDANLDGHSTGTADWPGWVPLIGIPPWKLEGGQ